MRRAAALDAEPRGLFAAVLFPVGQASQAGYDEPLAEAAIYDDGFAKIVHSFQPDTADAASSGHNKLRRRPIPASTSDGTTSRSVIWHNRQLEIRAGPARRRGDEAFGRSAAGRRRLSDRCPTRGAGDWHSLCAFNPVNASGNPAPLVFPSNPPPGFLRAVLRRAHRGTGAGAQPERGIERCVAAALLHALAGRSLVVTDDTLYKLTGGQPNEADGKPLEPATDVNTRLTAPTSNCSMAKVYEFRCRFADPPAAARSIRRAAAAGSGADNQAAIPAPCAVQGPAGRDRSAGAWDRRRQPM